MEKINDFLKRFPALTESQVLDDEMMELMTGGACITCDSTCLVGCQIGCLSTKKETDTTTPTTPTTPTEPPTTAPKPDPTPTLPDPTQSTTN